MLASEESHPSQFDCFPPSFPIQGRLGYRSPAPQPPREDVAGHRASVGGLRRLWRLPNWGVGDRCHAVDHVTGGSGQPGDRSGGPWTYATREAADQLDTAALHARAWHSDRPCPDPTIEEQSAAAFAAFTVLAHDCAAAGNSAAFGSGALDERAGQAVADLSIALYASEPWGGPADPRPLVGR
jgi:hypothetical protein